MSPIKRPLDLIRLNSLNWWWARGHMDRQLCGTRNRQTLHTTYTTKKNYFRPTLFKLVHSPLGWGWGTGRRDKKIKMLIMSVTIKSHNGWKCGIIIKIFVFHVLISFQERMMKFNVNFIWFLSSIRSRIFESDQICCNMFSQSKFLFDWQWFSLSKIVGTVLYKKEHIGIFTI